MPTPPPIDVDQLERRARLIARYIGNLATINHIAKRISWKCTNAVARLAQYGRDFTLEPAAIEEENNDINVLVGELERELQMIRDFPLGKD